MHARERTGKYGPARNILSVLAGYWTLFPSPFRFSPLSCMRYSPRVSCIGPARHPNRQNYWKCFQKANSLAPLCLQNSHTLARVSWQRSPWEMTCPPRREEETALNGVLPHNRSCSKPMRDRKTPAKKRERHWWKSATGKDGCLRKRGTAGPLCVLGVC